MNERLYILMRTDMSSLNPGKAMAQAAHAANHFIHNFEMTEAVKEWLAQGEGFGTTIVLNVGSEESLKRYTGRAEELGYPSDIILDTTYPIRDGDVTHLVPVITCGYIFAEGSPPFLRELQLHQ